MGFELFVTGVIGVVLFFFALKKGWGVVKDWRQYRKSENWVPINGQVTMSAVAEESSDESSTYAPFIRYTYQVMGETHQGSLISFGSEGVKYGSRKKAARIIARHPKGSQTVIHYDPDDPSLSVLERKFNLSNVISGLLLGSLGVGLIYLAYFQ